MTKRKQWFIFLNFLNLILSSEVNKLIQSVNSILFNHTIVKTQKTPSLSVVSKFCTNQSSVPERSMAIDRRCLPANETQTN